MPALTLSEAKEHLNITAVTYDSEIQSIMDSAEAAIAARCGLLSSVAASRRIAAGGAVMVLPSMPVVSLTSVTPVNGTLIPLTDLHLETSTGVVTFNTGATFSGLYDVVYQEGRTVVPADMTHAVKELVRHMWATSQRGGSRRPGSEAMAVNPATYLLPYQVQSLIEPYLQAPGVH